MTLAAGFILGLMGSLHCAGMCGPLVIAVAARHPRARSSAGKILYHAGRISAYSLLGFLLGLVGLSLGVAQQGLSITSGALLIIWVVFRKYPIPGAGWLSGLSSGWMSRCLAGSGWHSTLLLGFLNGLLPCGLTMTAWAVAAGTGSMLEGMSFMAAFGLGTTPMLLGLGWSAPWLAKVLPGRLNYMVPAVSVAMAALLIVRGLGLGIPYLSPDVSKPGGGCPHCAISPESSDPGSTQK